MNTFRNIFLILCAAAVLIYGILVGLVYLWEISVPEPENYNCIIVLGAQVLPDGEPSVQLRYRLETALEAYRDRPCIIVCCGARGSDEPAEEGSVMRDWLITHGAAEKDVLAETHSYSTRENIANAWNMLKEAGYERPLVVTSDYHLPRALAIARDAGLDPQGLGSPCKPELRFWLKSHCREALAWVKYWILG